MATQELFEAIPFELIEAHEIEHNGERLMQVRGIMHRANELNGNHRIYPAPVLSREVQKLKERLGSGDTVFSQADHFADGVSHISDTAAMLKNVEYTPQNEVIGTAVILPTQQGKDLAAIVRAGGKVGISVRGFGTTRPGEYAGQTGDVVQEDYQLVTYDFVIGQSLRHRPVPGPVVASMGRRPTIKQRKFAAALIGPAKGNQTLAAKMADYRGDNRVLAVQGSVNMRNPQIQQMLAEMLDPLVEPSVRRLAEGLDATTRRVFNTKTGLVYSEFEPNYRVRIASAHRILDWCQRSSDRHVASPDADNAIQQKNDGCIEPQKKIDGLDPIDRNLIRRTTDIDQKLADIEQQLAEEGDGTERQGQN